MVGINLLHLLVSSFPNHHFITTDLHSKPIITTPRITYIKANLKDKQQCQIALSNCKTAILTAALTGGALATHKGIILQLSDNILMDTVLFETLAENKVENIIYFSSATVYQEFSGFIKETDLDLNSPPNLANIAVGLAKRTSESILKYLGQKYNINIVILRCANIFGPYNKFDPATSNFIPALIRKATEKQDPFIIWGSPNVKRDVIFIKDICHAIVTILEQGFSGITTYNVGSGTVHSVQEIANAILQICNYKPSKIEYTQEHLSGANIRALNCSKIKEDIGWECFTNIEDALQITIEWWNSNKSNWKK